MIQQRHKGSVVGDDPRVVLADHRRLHAVIEDFLGHAAYRLERRHMAAHDRQEVPAGDEPAPEPSIARQGIAQQCPERGLWPGMIENSQTLRVMPFVGRSVHWKDRRSSSPSANDTVNSAKSTCTLATRRRLEAALEPCACRWTYLSQEIGHPRVAARVAHLPEQPGVSAT